MFNILITFILLYLSRLTTKPTKWHVRPAKTHISLGIRPVWSESSLSTWGKLRSLAIIRAHSEASDQTLGGCPGWSESLLGAKVILLVLSWGGSFYHVSLASTILISVILRRFYFLKFPEKVRVFMYPCTCMLVSVYYVTLQTSSNTFIFHDRRRISLFI